MKIILQIVLFLISTILFEACEKTDTNPKASATVEKTAISNDFVLIRVNGRELWKSTFDKWAWIKKKALSLSMSAQQKVSPENMSAIEASMLQSITNSFIREVVIDDYAREHNIVAHTNYIKFCRQQFLGLCNMSMSDWTGVCSKFTDKECSVISNRVEVEALDLSVKRAYVEKNPVTVDADEVEEIKKAFEDYNHNCILSNNVIFATASNVWTRIKNGEDFAELSIQYDEDEYRNEDGTWDAFTVADFDPDSDAQLRRHVRWFRPGYVTPPIESDNGLMIVRVDNVVDNGENVEAEDYIPSPDAEFHLSRIFFHLPEFIEKIDDTTFTRNVREAKSHRAAEDFINSLILKAKVEFPSGTEMFAPQESKSDALLPMNQ